jgi:hypothetical protein
VLSVHPTSTVALSYHDRIQFLIRQLSQRVGLTAEVQAEIRAYRSLLLQRKSNLINASLASARQMIDSGYLAKASEEVKKVLGIDPTNAYAKALLQRLAETKYKVETNGFPKGCSSPRSWPNRGGTERRERSRRESPTPWRSRSESRTPPQGPEKEARSRLYREALEEIWATAGWRPSTWGPWRCPAPLPHLTARPHAPESAFLKEVRRNRSGRPSSWWKRTARPSRSSFPAPPPLLCDRRRRHVR